MKIFIMTDLEGASCVAGTWDDINPGGREHDRARRFLTGDVNAAIQGAFEANANEVVVLDGHGAAFSILPEELDSRALLIRGRRIFEMEGLDGSFDAVLAIGAHSMAGTPGAYLPHTLSPSILGIWLNGRLVGEIGLWAAIAGHYSVPLVFVSGDMAATREAKELLGNIEVVTVKEATSMFSVKCIHPSITHSMIRGGVRHALSDLSQFKPFELTPPIEIKVRYANPYIAKRIAARPGVRVVDALTVAYEGDNILEAMGIIL